jgi:hypothetical protein
MLGRKAQLHHVWKWLVYIIVTCAVVFIITYIPVVVMGKSLNTQSLENIAFAERIYNKFSIYDPLLFRTYPGMTCSGFCFDEKFINDSFDNSGSLREVGFRLSLGPRSIFFNRVFYEDAVVLVPVRYDQFIEERPVILGDRNSVDRLVIDQVYSGRLKKIAD